MFNLDPTIISTLLTVLGMGFTTYISYRIARINNEHDFKKNVEMSFYKTNESNYFSFKKSCTEFLALADQVSRLPPANYSYPNYLASYREVALECSDESLALMDSFNSIADKTKLASDDYKQLRSYLEQITLSLRQDLISMRERNREDILK